MFSPTTLEKNNILLLSRTVDSIFLCPLHIILPRITYQVNANDLAFGLVFWIRLHMVLLTAANKFLVLFRPKLEICKQLKRWCVYPLTLTEFDLKRMRIPLAVMC